MVYRLQRRDGEILDITVAVVIGIELSSGQSDRVASGWITDLSFNPVVLRKRLTIRTGESIIGTPAVALVLH